MLSRRLLLAAATLPAAWISLSQSPVFAQGVPAAPLTPADRAAVGRVEAYLNSIKTLRAHFTQVAPDGSLSQGTLWLDRPGRMRFQYDPPAPFLLVAAHGVLTFNDSSLQQTTNIPLGRTPLGILLAEKVTLSGDVTITGMAQRSDQVQITLVRTASPGDGSLTLIFTEPPMTLRQWILVDAQQRATRVTLSNMQTGLNFSRRLFEQVEMPSSDLKTGG